MNTHIKDLLLIENLGIGELIETYREFFLAMIPGFFVIAAIVEYFDRLEPLSLMRRVLIAILILTSITHIYEKSIMASIDAANTIVESQKFKNVLLMDFFDYSFYTPSDPSISDFSKDEGALSGALSFLKYHLFSKRINDLFTLGIYFFNSFCFIILKIVYSLVYYLGYALIGIPCLIYIFPTMGNVLRGAILSYLWCLAMPHVLAIIISIIGVVINNGYQSGNIIGSSLWGTALLCAFSLCVVFSTLITVMILNGSGVAQAGGILAAMGANIAVSIPKHSVNSLAAVVTGGPLGAKTMAAVKGASFVANSVGKMNPFKSKGSDFNSANYYMGGGSSSSFKTSGNINKGFQGSKSDMTSQNKKEGDNVNKANHAGYKGQSIQSSNGAIKEYSNNLSTKEKTHSYGKEYAALTKQTQIETAKSGGVSTKTNEVRNGNISNNRKSNSEYSKKYTTSRNTRSNTTGNNTRSRELSSNKGRKK